MKMKKIGIVMGSDSDVPIIKEAVQTLREFGLDFDVNVISAHRSPERAHSYALEAEKKYEVIIVGAGGSAHLAGVIASLTPVPVIGIPMPTPELGGLDSLLSTVQMPSGVPVSTMGIGKAGAINAAILAIQILSVANPALRQKIVMYKKQLSNAVSRKDQGLRAKLGLE